MCKVVQGAHQARKDLREPFSFLHTGAALHRSGDRRIPHRPLTSIMHVETIQRPKASSRNMRTIFIIFYSMKLSLSVSLSLSLSLSVCIYIYMYICVHNILISRKETPGLHEDGKDACCCGLGQGGPCAQC